MTSTAMVPIGDQGRGWVTVLRDAAELAKTIANTDFVPKDLRGNPAAITAAILYGDEVGLGPMQSLAKISVIDGKPALAAETQRALALAAGHEIWLEESTSTKVTWAGRRKGADVISRVTWTMDDAKRARLDGKFGWRTYPRQMLSARASAELVRAIAPDATGGLAAIEEIADVEASGTAADVIAAPTATRRRQRKTIAAEAPTATPPAPIAAAPPLPPLPNELAASDASQQPPVEAEVAGDRRTDPQAKKLNVLVGQMREAGTITTEHVYRAVAKLRETTPAQLAEDVHGIDHQGQLHWAPLRDDLTKAEASALIERLEAIEVTPPEGPTASFAQLGQLTALLHDHGVKGKAATETWLVEQLGHGPPLRPEEAEAMIQLLQTASDAGEQPTPDDIPF